MDRSKTRKKRARRRWRGLRRLVLIALVVALSYGIFGLGRGVYQWIFFPPVRYVEAKSADNTILSGYAIFLRNELALVASRAGLLNKLVDHGSRVRAGEPLFELVDTTLLSSIDKQLAQIEVREDAALVPDAALLAREQGLAVALAAVRVEVAEVALGVRSGDFTRAAQAWRQLTRVQRTAHRLEQEYARVARTDTGGAARRGELLLQRQQAIYLVKAPAGGYISFAAGGELDTWSAANYGAVTLDVLRNRRALLRMRQNGDRLPAGQVVGIMIDNSTAVLVLEAQAELEIAEQVDVYLGEIVQVAHVLPTLPTSEAGTVLLPLRIDHPPFAFLELPGAAIIVRPRGQVLSLIPSSAVIVGPVTKVYVQLSTGELVERAVIVVDRLGRNVVVSGVLPQEILVANPQRLPLTRSTP